VKVRDLIKALQNVSPSATVHGFNTDDQNEFTVTAVLLSQNTVLLSSETAGDLMSNPNDVVLHMDLTEDDGQFGAGA